MISGFLNRLLANGSNFGILALQKFSVKQELITAEIKLPEYGFRPVPVRLFYENKIFVFIYVAQIGQVIFCNFFSGSHLIDPVSRKLVKISCLSDQIQRNI